MFAKDLTDESREQIQFRVDTCNFVAEACRDIRDRIFDKSRNLLILKCFNLTELNIKEVDRLSNKVDWVKEIIKRLGIKVNSRIYTDVILPVTFNDTWVLMSWNFETRQIKVLYFQKETRAMELKLLMKAADKIWREACMAGLKCVGEVYWREELHEKEWKTLAS